MIQSISTLAFSIVSLQPPVVNPFGYTSTPLLLPILATKQSITFGMLQEVHQRFIILFPTNQIHDNGLDTVPFALFGRNFQMNLCHQSEVVLKLMLQGAITNIQFEIQVTVF